MTFRQSVIKVVKSIPRGRTLSYKEVATLAGSPRAARAIGSIMRSNRDLKIPCHRVIRSSGSLGGYNGLRGSKKEILNSESTFKS